MPRLPIRALLWLFAIVAIFAAWWADRQKLNDALNETGQAVMAQPVEDSG
jgi:hypothetical protein